MTFLQKSHEFVELVAIRKALKKKLENKLERKKIPPKIPVWVSGEVSLCVCCAHLK